ncbi:hypothetical protein [Rhizobium sp. L1K21]|uniref:hypothetical protein n=1 Tax=Rhizobium sp. L1K21 TaxID=2954933 RepID=UPI00209223CC|nr:hypothetical protein [Rhizobium sp. L1K21]MCO6187806.1 hypothetical protein [Rhizobium sp. L1K21]
MTERTDEKNITENGPAETAHERQKGRPDAGDVSNPKEVWKDSETTPSRQYSGGRSGGGERVADAGDIGSGSPSPYTTETQADEVGGQNRTTTGSEERKN